VACGASGGWEQQVDTTRTAKVEVVRITVSMNCRPNNGALNTSVRLTSSCQMVSRWAAYCTNRWKTWRARAVGSSLLLDNLDRFALECRIFLDGQRFVTFFERNGR